MFADPTLASTVANKKAEVEEGFVVMRNLIKTLAAIHLEYKAAGQQAATMTLRLALALRWLKHRRWKEEQRRRQVRRQQCRQRWSYLLRPRLPSQTGRSKKGVPTETALWSA